MIVFGWMSLAMAAPCLPVTASELGELSALDWDAWGALHHRLEACPDPQPLPPEAVGALFAALATLAEADGLSGLAQQARLATSEVAAEGWVTLEDPAWVNGVWRQEVPAGRPTLIQHASQSGLVRQAELFVHLDAAVVLREADRTPWLAAPAPLSEASDRSLAWRARWGGPPIDRMRFGVLIRGGWALGRLNNRFTTLSWQGGDATWDRLDGGGRLVLDLGASLELTSWLEVGVSVGLYGWQQVEEAQAEPDGASLTVDLVDETGIGGVEAFSRLRPVAFGPLCWWATVGLNVRFYDASASGWVWSPVVGPGVGLELGPHLRLSLEVLVAPWGSLDVRTGDEGAALDALTSQGVSGAMWTRSVLGVAWRL